MQNSKSPVREIDYYAMPVNWMLASFLSLPWESQMGYLPFPPLRFGDADFNLPSKNIVNQILRSIRVHLNFEGELDNECINLLTERIRDVIEVAWISGVDMDSMESFCSGSSWDEIRGIASELLDALALGFYEPPKPIDFSCLIEIVDPPPLEINIE